jgi:signal transduction histidine kinase
MLKSLRLQLTLFYLFISALFVLLLGGGLYFLLDRYFQITTDQALKYRLVQQLDSMQLPLPTDLANENFIWIPRATIITEPQLVATKTVTTTLTASGQRSTATPDLIIVQIPAQSGGEIEDEEESEEEHDQSSDSEATAPIIKIPVRVTADPRTATPQSHELMERITGDEIEHEYEGELSPIFVLRVDAEGNQIVDPQAAPAPIEPEIETARKLIPGTYQFSTVQSADGTKIRLLTYTLPAGSSAAFIQLGRPIDDQTRLMKEFLMGLLGLGGISLILLALGGWLLSGRSIRPAEKAFEQQQAFVANASHELRTPLTLMRASAELALKGSRDGKTRSLLSDVLQDADYMTQMVADLLLLSRLDNRNLKLKQNRVDLHPLFVEIERKADRLAAEKQIKFNVEKPELVILGDEQHLQQVIWILIDNALQYTPAGGKINLFTEDLGRQARITVSDNGQGIPAEHLQYVFERFYKAGSGESRGAGLGLSLAKALVEGMGGKIELRSQPDLGTQAIVILVKA